MDKALPLHLYLINFVFVFTPYNYANFISFDSVFTNSKEYKGYFNQKKKLCLRLWSTVLKWKEEEEKIATTLLNKDF